MRNPLSLPLTRADLTLCVLTGSRRGSSQLASPSRSRTEAPHTAPGSMESLTSPSCQHACGSDVGQEQLRTCNGRVYVALRCSRRGPAYHLVRLRADWAQVHSQVLGAVQAQRDRRLQHARSQRRDGLRALYNLLYNATSPAEQEFFPNVHAFLRLPSIEVLWQPEDAVIDTSSWAALTPKIRLDIQRQARIDKIRYFDQLARALLSIGIHLPAYIVNLITAEPSVFVDDADDSKGVAPLHDQLTDGQLLGLLHGPLAVFTCSFCGWSFPIRDHNAHLDMRHRPTTWSSQADAKFQPVSSSYLGLLHQVITSVGLDSLAAYAGDLENLGPHFEVRMHGGEVITGVHWADLVSVSYCTAYSIN